MEGLSLISRDLLKHELPVFEYQITRATCLGQPVGDLKLPSAYIFCDIMFMHMR